MKKQCMILAAAAVTILSLAPLATAQQAAVSSTTTSTTFTPGVISEFSPDTIVIRSESAPAPIRYSYTKTTTYVDEDGQPVTMDIIKSGLPVKVYYIKEGDRMIANRVVVSRKKTSTSTTTSGAAVTEKKTSTTTSPAPVLEEKKSSTTTTTTSPK